MMVTSQERHVRVSRTDVAAGRRSGDAGWMHLGHTELAQSTNTGRIQLPILEGKRPYAAKHDCRSTIQGSIIRGFLEATWNLIDFQSLVARIGSCCTVSKVHSLSFVELCIAR